MKIPRTIKAVIFDMDGVLIDSEPYWMRANEDFFSLHNKKHTPEVTHKIMGMGHKDIMERFKEEYGFDGDTDALIAQRKAFLYKKLLPEISLMEGARDLITDLQKRKFPMAIATGGHGREKMKELLAILKIDNAFKEIVTADEVAHGKPAPDIFLKAGASLKVDPSSCLIFEDAPNGVLAGKAAGMTVFAVNQDTEWRKKLQEAGADMVFKSLLEITA
jgi:16S rRNA pseudouridine516 synthase